MAYRIEYDEAEDCGYVIAVGTLTVDDYKELFRAAWARPEYLGARCAVWDFSECRMHFDTSKVAGDFSSLSADEKKRAIARLGMQAMQELAAFTRANRPPRLPPRIAVVTATDIDYGMTRVYNGFSGLKPEDLRVFRSLDDARRWLFS